MTRRWLAIAVAALAATLGGLVLSGCGSSSPKPARNSAPKGRVSSCEGDDCFDTRISGQLKVGEGIYLTLSALDTKNPGDNEAKECTNPRRGIPTDVDSRTSPSVAFCYEIGSSQNTTRTRNSRIVFYYEIHRIAPNLPDTGYYVDGYALVPGIGANELSCTIRKRATNDVATNSPYTCSVAWGDSNPHSIDPQPHWTIGVKPTKVIDASDSGQVDQAVTLLNSHCGIEQTAQCTYKATKQQVLSDPRDKWLLYGQPYGNCVNPNGAPYELDVSKTLSWSDSVSTKVKAQFNIKVVKADIDVGYQHSVSESYNISQKYGMSVPYKKIGAFYIQPGYLEITGDFQVVSNDAIYDIKNVTVHYPLGNEYSPPGHPELKFEPAIIHGMVLGDDTSCGTGKPPASLKPGSHPPAGAKDLGPAKTL